MPKSQDRAQPFQWEGLHMRHGRCISVATLNFH